MKTLHFIATLFIGSLMIMSTAALLSTTGLSPTISVGVSCALAAGVTLFSEFLPKGLSFLGVCGEISASILRSCDYPLQAGTRDRAIIINLDDISSIVYNVSDGETVEDIILVSGAVAYQVDGKNNSIAPKSLLVKIGFNKMFDHEVMMKGFDISPAIKSNLNKMKDGRFVIITENYFKGENGKSAFEIYGLTTGLEMTVLERDPNNADTQGAFDFTFFTDVNKEPRLPNALFITNYATTKAIVDGLL